MIVAINKPSEDVFNQFLQQQEVAGYTYPEVGATRGHLPKGYTHDKAEIYLGQGEECWERAKLAIGAWAMFPRTWTRIDPVNAPQNEGKAVAISFRMLGLWWFSSAKIVYTLDTEDRFGFAYGTLPGHVAQGEELFEVRRHADGSVWYHLAAFSKPAKWYVWLGYPLARWTQARFRKESCQQMFEFVK
ncbi:MAG: DUF1990 domain-containing protein [Bacteroidota bacterium]